MAGGSPGERYTVQTSLTWRVLLGEGRGREQRREEEEEKKRKRGEKSGKEKVKSWPPGI